MKEKRLAVFLPSLRGGGAERVLLSIANAAVERAIPCDLVLADASGQYLAEVSPGLRLIDLRCVRVSRCLLPYVRYLRTERPHCVLAAMPHTNAVAIVGNIMSGWRTRIVISERNAIARSGTATKAAMRLYLSAVRLILYPLADAIIAVSDGVADELRRTRSMAYKEIHTIVNPVDLATVRRRSREPVPHAWLEDSKLPVVLAAGSLTVQKDFATLLTAFARLRQTTPARLIILGDGELRDDLLMLARHLDVQHDVAMPGFVHNPYAWMSRAQTFVLSSRWEGMPNVLLQAMACGCSIVSTDCEFGPRQVLEGGRWGRLVPVGDAEALAAAISQSLADDGGGPQPQAALGAFSLQEISTRYLEVCGMQSRVVSRSTPQSPP